MKAQVTLHTGSIIVAAPFENAYQVSTDIGTLNATALETGSGRRGGHIGGGGYVPGAEVLVAQIVRTDVVASRLSFPNIIVGAFNPYPTFEGTEFKETEIVPDTEANAVKNEAYRRILENQAETNFMNENRGANRPLDILPGDWFKSTVLGGCFLLSEFMAKVGASPDCALTFNGLDKMAEIISHNFSADHGSQFRELIHRGLTPIDVDRFALSLNEGLGGYPPFTISEDDGVTIIPASQTQIGFFRRSLFQGGVEGVWDLFQANDTSRENQEVHTFGEYIYPGMLSETRRMDGIMRMRAAKEIKFEKTYGIVGPWLKTELRGAEPSPERAQNDTVDIQFKQEQLGLASEDEVSALRPLLHDAFDTVEEEQFFFNGLRRDGGVWYFPTVDEVKAQVFDTEDPVLRVLDEQEQEYTLEDVISKDIEVYPGRKVRLFKNSSVFLMSDDGGLILGDGFGAELRMNRGSITIAAAGDLQFLPGRDLVEQVPGNRLSRVGQRVEVSSTEGSITHKAASNIHLCSGGESGGALVLENRSPSIDMSQIEEDTLRKGLPYGSGVIIKNLLAGTQIQGSYLHASAYAEAYQSRFGMDESGKPCDIMINAGSGDLGLRGANAVMAFRNSVSLTMMEQATGVYLAQDHIMLLARSRVSAVTQQMLVTKTAGEVFRPRLTASKVDISRRSQLPATDPSFEVDGQILAKTNIGAKGQIQSESSVISNQGANAEPITRESERVRLKLASESISSAEYSTMARNAALISQGLLQRMVSEGAATQWGQKIMELAFPDSDTDAYRGKYYRLVAPRWQSMLPDQSRTWIESEVAHAILKGTYPYPGRTVHTEGTPLVVDKGTDIENKALNQYKVNLQ